MVTTWVAVLAFLALTDGYLKSLEKSVDFGLAFYEELNLDAALGYTIAEAQLLQIKPKSARIFDLIKKCEHLRHKLLAILPKNPPKMQYFEKYLLNPINWQNPSFPAPLSPYSGTYPWTNATILRDTKATYKGVPTDHCLVEILAGDCRPSAFCREMMLAPRIDHGYLLTHRLLYLQVARIKKCAVSPTLVRFFCLFIFKEARTSQKLAYPSHDIFLEQGVLCGVEGYVQFMNEEWGRKVIEWQTPEGCFQSQNVQEKSKRSSNVISFGCADHTTGLGAAALALHLKHAASR